MSYSLAQIEAAILIAASSDNPSVQSAVDSLVTMISLNESAQFEAAKNNARGIARRKIMLNPHLEEPTEMTLIPYDGKLFVGFHCDTHTAGGTREYACAVYRLSFQEVLQSVAENDDAERRGLLVQDHPVACAFIFSRAGDLINFEIETDTDGLVTFTMDRAQFDELREAVG